MINALSISYPDFKLNDLIDPDAFDINNAQFQTKINEIKDVLNKLTDSITDGASGADTVSLTAITPFASSKLQAFLEEMISRIQAVADGVSGADLVGSTLITGVTGSTVQAQLESLKSLLDALTTTESGHNTATNARVDASNAALTLHKTSTDHDSRYYTESEIDTKLSLKSDITTIYTRSSLDSGTLDARYYTEPEVDTKLASLVAGSVPDGSITRAKLDATLGTAVDNASGVRANSALEFRLEVRTSDPVSPAVGRMWFRSDLG